MIRKSFVVLSLLVASNVCAQEWVYPTGEKAITIFYQSMNCSQTQGAKYTGKHGFISPTTGEHIVCDKSIDIIDDLWVEPEIDEVVPAPTNRSWKSLCLQPRNLIKNLWQYAHETISRISHYIHGIRVIRQLPTKAQTLAAHSVIVSKINIAQEGDLANHRKRVEACLAANPKTPKILKGVSRGAGTTAQAAALYNKEKHSILDTTKLIQLEGCFDDVEHTMKARHPWLLRYDACLNVLEKMARKVIAFRKEGPSPIKAVKDYPKHIPIAFITSAKDREVPAECTKKLIKALLAEGHENLYLLELRNSSHSGYVKDDPRDSTEYQNFAHAIRKHLNLPYIPAYADAGKDLVEAARMNAQALK